MKKYIFVISSVLILGIIGFLLLSNKDSTENSSSTVQSTSEDNVQTTNSIESTDEDLLAFVEKDSAEYKNAISFTGDDYDQYFIANMIHYADGIAQLESMAAKSSNPELSQGAAERASQATADVQMYKDLQDKMGYPISYGNQMEYHAAMGADSEVYFAVSSLEGFTGSELDQKLAEQLKYFQRAETQIAGAGLNNAKDNLIKELVVQTLKNNNTQLERL